ncbi:MAG: AI-2E family transporter [Nitrospirales bacterium]|nr:AI-2E family transporter [Nitrospirales bacterium]
MPPTTTPSPRSQFPADRHLWEIVPCRDLFILIVAGCVIGVCFLLQAILIPVFIGLGLAYLINPALNYVENTWKLPRWAAVTFMAIVIGVPLAGLGIWIAPVLIEQTQEFVNNIPSYVSVLAHRHGVELKEFSRSFQEFSANLQQDPLSTIKTVLAGTGQVLHITNLIVGTLWSFLFSFSLIVIYFFFFAWSFPALQRSCWRMIEAIGDPRWPALLTKMNQAIGDFFRGRLLIALLMGGMFGIGWWWVDVPYWGLLGIGAGLLSLIPYAATASWPLAILLKYLDLSVGAQTVDHFWMDVVVWPSVVYLIVQVFEGWVLTPWVQSQSSDLSAATVLLAVLIGGALGGVLGLILAIPLTSCMKIMAHEFIVPRFTAWKNTDRSLIVSATTHKHLGEEP